MSKTHKEEKIDALIVRLKKDVRAELEKQGFVAPQKQSSDSEKIEKLVFIDPAKTAYGKALGGQPSKPFLYESEWFGVEIGGFVGCGFLLSGILALIFDSNLFFLIVPALALLAGNAILFSLNSKHKKRQLAKDLADPIAQFEYRIAKAIKIFNTRAAAYNHLVKGCAIGVIQKDPEELSKIKKLLLDARASLEIKPKLLNWLKEAEKDALLSETPQLALSLGEIEETEQDLLSSVEQLASADPQMQLLENETALADLEADLKGLLPEKT